MTTLNLDDLDEALRQYLRMLEARGHEAFASLVTGYGHRIGDHPLSIRFCSEGKFDAAAWREDGTHCVEIDLACISLTDALLRYLFAQPDILPRLSIDAVTCTRTRLPFARKLFPISLDCGLDFDIDDRRFHIARVMADFWNTYVLCHELGHLLCGHEEGSRFLLGQAKHREYFNFDKWRFRGRYLRRAWEVDADVFAGVLVSQHIGHFLSANTAPEVRQAFAWCRGDAARITGLVLAAFHAMFVYVSQGQYGPSRRTIHPSPPLRSKTIGNVIIGRMSATHGICPQQVHCPNALCAGEQRDV